jgi:hypothetical protein
MRGGDLRNQHYDATVLGEMLAQDDLRQTYGDKVVVSRLRLDADGAPVGNRQERRLAKRMLRRLR